MIVIIVFQQNTCCSWAQKNTPLKTSTRSISLSTEGPAMHLQQCICALLHNTKSLVQYKQHNFDLANCPVFFSLYTYSESTNYYFDITKDYLHGALDRHTNSLTFLHNHHSFNLTNWLRLSIIDLHSFSFVHSLIRTVQSERWRQWIVVLLIDSHLLFFILCNEYKW
jgi:hypothetical protein